MSFQEIYLLLIIILAMLLILSDRMRADLVALLVLLALAVGGVVDPQEALSGFSRSAVITIVGLFVITEALERTGITHRMAELLIRVAGNSEPRMVFLLLIAAAMLSLFMNNIAAGAMLLPAAINISRRTSIPPSRLLMPLAFGTLLGGMATYFTTANILVSNALRDNNLQPLGVLDFTPTGGVVALSGIIFMVFIGRRMLPLRKPAAQYAPRQSAPDLEKAYELSERLWEARVEPNSPLAELTLAETCIGERYGVTITAIWHRKVANLTPSPEDILHEGDIVLVAGREERINELAQEGLKIGRTNGHNGHLYGPGVSLVEMLVAPRSQAEGKCLKELNFRKKYGMTAVALWRDGHSFRTDVGNFPLKFGDALLMVGEPDRIKILRNEPEFLILEESTDIPNPEHGPIAIAITVLVLLIAALNFIPIAESMLLGAVLMVLTGCLTMDEGYRAIEWRVIFMIAGLLPISIAMVKTGLAAQLAELLVGIVGPLGPLAVMGSLYLLTVLLTQIMSGQVTALVLAPIAISAALQIHSSPQAACVAVAIGCSTCFLTPISHPINVLMMGPAGYTFADFGRVGWLLTIVCLIALMLSLPIFWRL